MFVRTEHLFPPPTESATKPSVKCTCDGCRMEVFIDSDVELQDSEFPVKLVLEPLKITTRQYVPPRRGEGRGDEVLVLPGLKRAVVSSACAPSKEGQEEEEGEEEAEEGENENENENEQAKEANALGSSEAKQLQVAELIAAAELTLKATLPPDAPDTLAVATCVMLGHSNAEDGYDFTSLGKSSSVVPNLEHGPFSHIPCSLLLQEEPDEKVRSPVSSYPRTFSPSLLFHSCATLLTTHRKFSPSFVSRQPPRKCATPTSSAWRRTSSRT